MPDNPKAEERKTSKALQAEQRRARLAAQLRSNLKKRKQRSHECAEADMPSAVEGTDRERS
jgi:hypothetical protein